MYTCIYLADAFLQGDKQLRKETVPRADTVKEPRQGPNSNTILSTLGSELATFLSQAQHPTLLSLIEPPCNWTEEE